MQDNNLATFKDPIEEKQFFKNLITLLQKYIEDLKKGPGDPVVLSVLCIYVNI